MKRNETSTDSTHWATVSYTTIFKDFMINSNNKWLFAIKRLHHTTHASHSTHTAHSTHAS